MSFLTPLLGSVGGALASNPNLGMGLAGMLGLGGGKGGGGDGGQSGVAQVNPGYTPAAPAPNFAAKGLGHLIGVDPGKISSIAESVGKGANQIASAGGAQGGYAAPVQNHLQLLDPAVIQELIRAFSGRSAQGQIQ